MMSRLPAEIKKKVILFFSSHCSLHSWTLKICYQAILKIAIPRSFKLDQLIEDDE